MNLKKTFIYMLTLLPKGVQQIIKFFWLNIFSICHRCQRHRWCILSCEYLRAFLKKFETAPMVWSLSGAWGKLIHVENLKSKIFWHCPFKLFFSAGVRRGVSYLTLPAFLLKFLPSVQRERQVRDHHSLLTERKYCWNLVAVWVYLVFFLYMMHTV